MLFKDTKPTRKSNKRKLLLPLILFTTLTLLGSGLRFGEAQTQREPGTVQTREPGTVFPDSGDTVAGSLRVTLPSYIIEPPDILRIEVHNMVPKAPYLLKVFDIVTVEVIGTPPEDPINGPYCIEPDGEINFGAVYGSVKVEGLSTEDATQAVVKHLSWDKEEKQGFLINPIVSVRLFRMGEIGRISGNHTVGPDGYITLGSYGRVYVNGLTIPECKEAVEVFLAKSVDKPQVAVEVLQMNSKKYYVVFRWTTGDRVIAFPYTGNDTVMSAMAQCQAEMSSALDIKLLRPGDGKPTMVLPLDWEKILISREGFGHNVQLLPGDRIVLEMNGEFSTNGNQ